MKPGSTLFKGKPAAHESMKTEKQKALFVQEKIQSLFSSYFESDHSIHSQLKHILEGADQVDKDREIIDKTTEGLDLLVSRAKQFMKDNPALAFIFESSFFDDFIAKPSTLDVKSDDIKSELLSSYEVLNELLSIFNSIKKKAETLFAQLGAIGLLQDLDWGYKISQAMVEDFQPVVFETEFKTHLLDIKNSHLEKILMQIKDKAKGELEPLHNRAIQIEKQYSLLMSKAISVGDSVCWSDVEQSNAQNAEELKGSYDELFKVIKTFKTNVNDFSSKYKKEITAIREILWEAKNLMEDQKGREDLKQKGSEYEVHKDWLQKQEFLLRWKDSFDQLIDQLVDNLEFKCGPSHFSDQLKQCFYDVFNGKKQKGSIDTLFIQIDRHAVDVVTSYPHPSHPSIQEYAKRVRFVQKLFAGFKLENASITERLEKAYDVAYKLDRYDLYNAYGQLALYPELVRQLKAGEEINQKKLSKKERTALNEVKWVLEKEKETIDWCKEFGEIRKDIGQLLVTDEIKDEKINWKKFYDLGQHIGDVFTGRKSSEDFFPSIERYSAKVEFFRYIMEKFDIQIEAPKKDFFIREHAARNFMKKIQDPKGSRKCVDAGDSRLERAHEYLREFDNFITSIAKAISSSEEEILIKKQLIIDVLDGKAPLTAITMCDGKKLGKEEIKEVEEKGAVTVERSRSLSF